MSVKKTKATTDALTRILVYLKIAKVPVIRAMIIKGTRLNSYTANDALKWLESHNMVKKTKDPYELPIGRGRWKSRGVCYYYLNTKIFK